MVRELPQDDDSYQAMYEKAKGILEDTFGDDFEFDTQMRRTTPQDLQNHCSYANTEKDVESSKDLKICPNPTRVVYPLEWDKFNGTWYQMYGPIEDPGEYRCVRDNFNGLDT